MRIGNVDRDGGLAGVARRLVGVGELFYAVDFVDFQIHPVCRAYVSACRITATNAGLRDNRRGRGLLLPDTCKMSSTNNELENDEFEFRALR